MGTKVKNAMRKLLVMLLILGTVFGMIPGLDQVGLALGKATDGAIGVQEADAATKYIVRFYLYNGAKEGNSYLPEIYATQEVWGGNTLTRPSNPVRNGYTFDKWYKMVNNVNQGVYDFSVPVSGQAFALLGKWKQNIQVAAYDKTNGTVGGGTVKVTGTFPDSSSTTQGPSASFTKDFFEDERYGFQATASSDYVFKGWAFNNPTNTPVNFQDTIFSFLYLNEYNGSIINSVYAIFEKRSSSTSSDEYYLYATEGSTGGHEFPITVRGDANYPVNVTNLYSVDDPAGISTSRWVGTNNGIIPAGGSAQYVITTKDGIAPGEYTLRAIYDWEGNQIIYIVHVIVSHKLTGYPGQNANCENAGRIPYWSCSVCNKVFSDAEATNEIQLSDTVLPAIGHNYGVWQYLNETNHRHYCANNSGHFETRAHSWDAGEVTTPATCTTNGIKTFTCQDCGGTKTQEIAKLNHNYGAWTKVDDNQHKRVCANDNSHVETANHNWNNGVVTTEPTETSTGVKTYTCSVCNGTKTETIPALTHEHTYGSWSKFDNTVHQRVCSKDSSHVETAPHTWNSGVITKAATCDATGTKTYTCTVCNGTKTETIPALGHNYGQWQYLNSTQHRHYCANNSGHYETRAHSWDAGEVTTPATCTTNGIKTFTCQDCGGTKTETIQATGHNYGAWTKVDNNQHKRVCANDNSHVEIANHSWNNGVVTTEPTETSTGVKTYTCSVCKGTKTETIPALTHEHTYGSWSKFDNTVHQRVCSKDSSHVETAPHTWNSGVITKAATCDATGTKTYTCTVCNGTKTETIQATGHDYGAWTRLNSTQHQRVCNNDSTHVQKQNHSWGDGNVTTAPTETSTGVRTYTCSVCNAKKTESIPALEHTHNLVKTPAKAATCTTAGNKAYWTCSSCGKVFSNSAGTNETTVTAMRIAALGHEYGDVYIPVDETNHKRVCQNDESHEKVDSHNWSIHKQLPTCWAEGLTTYICLSCDYEKEETVPMVAHTMTKIAAKAATCTAAGNIEYYKCSECKKYFTDAQGNNNIQLSETVISALGHSYGAWNTTKAPTCTEKGTEERTCTRCNNKQTRNIAATGHDFAHEEYISINDEQHKEICGNDSSHESVSDHNWFISRQLPSCWAEGKNSYRCLSCGHEKEETVAKTAHTLTKTAAKAPTCTAAGNKAYWKCSVCYGVFSDSAGKNETTVEAMRIPATGHDWGAWTKLNSTQHQRVCENDSAHVETKNHTWNSGVITTQPTTTSTGVKTYTCTTCNAKKTETVPKLSDDDNPATHTHTLVKTAAKAATCTTAGNKAYWTCSDCGKVYSNSAGTNETTVAAMKIAATGHGYGAWTKLNSTQHQRVCNNDSTHVETKNHTWNSGVVTTQPTTTSTGVRKYTCTVCNATKTETIPKLSGDDDTPDVPVTHTHTLVKTAAKAATCTTAGNKAYWTCSDCKKVYSNSAGTNETTVAAMRIAATGHDYGSWIKVSATQHKKVCNNDSSHVVTEKHTFNKHIALPTCWEEGVTTYTCNGCGYEYSETVDKVPHVLTKVSAISATCTTSGHSAYYKCSECFKLFKDSKATKEITLQDTLINPTGHAYGEYEKVDGEYHQKVCANDPSHVIKSKHNYSTNKLLPTCWSEGKNTYTCLSCGYKKEEVVEKKPHTLVKTAAKAATCTASGNIAYWRCSVCYDYFSDKDGKNKIKLSDTVVPAKGHDYGPWTKLNATQHQRVCKNDSAHVQTANHVWDAGKVTKAATETATGIRTYTCTTCKATKTETIPKVTHSHKLTKTAYKAATCTTAGNKAYWTCSGCKKVFSDSAATNETTVSAMIIKATGHNYGEWTKLNATQHQRVCKYDATHVEKANHTWDSGKVTKEPTTTATGVKTYTCTVCKATKTETIEKLSPETPATHTHTLVKTKAKLPTCTTDGYSAYWTCSDCKKIFSDSKGTKETTMAALKLKATGHNYTDWEVILEAGCDTEGKESCYCINNPDHTKTRVIPATGHNWGAWTNLNQMYHSRTCKKNVGHVERKEHTWKEEVTKKATATTEGNLKKTCTVCGAVVNEPIPKTGGYTGSATIDRIAGDDRYRTAEDLADEYMKTKNIGKVKYIIVARGDDFPDALAASALAKAKNAPIILWRAKENANVQKFIREHMDPGTGVVYLLGGEAVVADSVKSGMTGYTFKRLAGKTRYETNIEILKQAKVKGGEILVCDAASFQNPLIASATGKPILLVIGDTLRPMQVEFLSGLSDVSFTIIGNTNKVSSKIEAALKAYGTVSKRITGSTADQISVKVAKAYYKNPTEVILARDDAYPDGLCAGPLAITKSAPLLLVSNNSYANSKSYCAGLNLKKVTVLGGNTYIKDSTVKAIANIK